MRTTRWGPLTAAAIVLILGWTPGARAQMAPCEASSTVRAALRDLSGRDLDAQAELAAFRALLKRYPNDLFVHQDYQDTAMYPTVKDRDAVIAEYRALADKRKGNPVFEYLAVRPVIGANTKQVLPDLERLAGRVPAAHLSLVRIFQSTAFKDPAKAREHLDAFMTACPTTPTAFQYLRSVEAPDYVKANAEKLRVLLRKRTDANSIRYYTDLWSLEFRVRPAGEHDHLRQQIAEDLKRLRSLGGDDAWHYSILQHGYKLANDSEGAQWAAEQMARFSFYSTRELWLKGHPYPKAGDSPEQRKVFDEALAKASADWVAKWPNSVSAWFDRVDALISAEAPAPADVEAAGEGLLNAVARNPGQMSFGGPRGSSFTLVVAYLYATHGVAVSRLPALVSQGISENDSPAAGSAGLPSDLYPRPAASSRESPYPWLGRVIAVDIWVKVKDTDRARKALSDLQARLDASKPKGDSKDPEQDAKRRAYMSRQVDYWSRLGDLAKLEGRKTDAMTFYQNAMLARSTPPAAGAKDELGEKARALWTELGGGNEAWQAWFSRRDVLGVAGPAASAGLTWAKLEKPLPGFELGDLAGAKWRLADLKGKTTLVGIWATW